MILSPNTYIMDFAPFRQLVIARAANKLVAVVLVKSTKSQVIDRSMTGNDFP